MNSFDLVKSYLLELDYHIVSEDEKEQVVIIEKEEEGIKNLILDVEEPILVLEQHLFNLKEDAAPVLKALLEKNTEIVHGAFAIADGNKVIFRDTLQLENLDLNELEASLGSLSLLLSEYYNEILSFAK